MKIQLTETERLEIDELGYTLFTLRETRNRRTGNLVTKWHNEGYYGTLEQVAHGMHRHKFQATSIATVEEMIRAQNEFVTQYSALLRIMELAEQARAI